MINSRSVDDLTYDTRIKALDFKNQCALAGCPIIFTSTYRDHESQNDLYAMGRTKPGSIVTQVRGGDSFHQYRVAFDFVPVVDGKAVWGNESLWAKAGAIGVQCGLEWGGNWRSFKDKPHMQNTGGKTIAEFKAGKV
jgi:peptidoglycan L-alanyl-D-glutamate endopeptidase CwlK